MAFATEITIGTGSKMSANYQSNEFNVSLTYQLERDDVDLLEIAEEKAAEVETLHTAIRRKILQLRVQPVMDAKGNGTQQSSPHPAANGSTTTQVAVSSQVAVPASPAPGMQHEASITEAQKRVASKLVERADLTGNELEKLLSCRFGRRAVAELTQRQGRMLIADLQRRIQRLNTKTDSDADA
jgi:hypothetical protein